MNTTVIMKALADDVRIGIVRHLSAQTKPVAASNVMRSCSKALELTQPTMSHHICKLVQAGILTEQKHGKQKFYMLEIDRLRAIGIDATKL